ncbi:Vacuolar protein sorting-associated protein 41 [Arachnomyces sp. PD_36]|nr:Vacuolar protein sorting-associated protein 41 [Arachnomyces sp. PD_36]
MLSETRKAMMMEAHGAAEPNKKGVTEDGGGSSAISVTTDPKSDDDGTEAEETEDEEEDGDDEPRLKYLSLTKNLSSLYRGGDATSCSLVGGDKMVIGTHNGNIHVLSLPLLQSLRVYHAHSASVSSVSIAPFPLPLQAIRSDAVDRTSAETHGTGSKASSQRSLSPSSSKKPPVPRIPPTPSNSIYIASSSIDGNVCVSSLLDPKDVLLRNFGRPVQAVALSPEYKSDRSYLSGGLAGNLILTTGGRVGTSSNSTTMGGAAAAASGWLGTIGLGANTGKDTILHSGEGAISTIKWSLSGKYVVWVNEEGIKIMRSNLHLDTADSEFAWKRMSHIDRPNRPGWEEMASVWKARAEWIDEDALNLEEQLSNNNSGETQPPKPSKAEAGVEKLVVGWGGTIWIIKVFPGGAGSGKEVGERKNASAQVATMFVAPKLLTRFTTDDDFRLRTDCIISGISLYTPNLLIVLSYITSDEEEDAKLAGPSRGIHRRETALEPELRLIDIETKEEVAADPLPVSRYKKLSSSDYHLGVLPPMKVSVPGGQRGALGAIGTGLWDATLYPTRLFSSAASIRSSTSSSEIGSSQRNDMSSRRLPPGDKQTKEINAVSTASGVKIFIHSPYDCLAAVKRDLSDRLSWLNTQAKYEEAWNLINEHPEAAGSVTEKSDSVPGTPTKPQTSLADFFADDSVSILTVGRASNSVAEKEKRRIGELWIEQLISEHQWSKAGEICGKVLDTATRWDHWVWLFARNNKIEEITPYIPVNLSPPLSAMVYEVILGHYVSLDRPRFSQLLELWPSDLFDVKTVITAIENQIESKNVAPDTDDWNILTDCLAKLFLAEGQYREALRCYIRLHDAEAAMNLIRDYHLLDAISDDIPGLILIRVSNEQLKSAPIAELQEATSEPIKMLVSEAYSGIVPPETVVSQLEAANRHLYLYFYLRALWRGDSMSSSEPVGPRRRNHRQADAADKLAADEGKALIDGFADTAVELFADYDRPLLMEFLQSSTSYSYSVASSICESRHFTSELIYLLSKTGETKRALNLILSDLKDVSQAIAFARSQDDPDLWDDLLDYSMDKPEFIRSLLAEAGTSIDPIKLVKRIPSGVEIEGLREGLTRMIREHDIQASISQGVAKVLQGEVAIGMDKLRNGQRRGIKFDVVEEKVEDIEAQGLPQPTETDPDGTQGEPKQDKKGALEPGHCAGCHASFITNETEPLVGFACGHIFHVSHLQQSRPATATTTDSASTPTGTTAPAPSNANQSTPTTHLQDEEDPTFSPFLSRTVAPKVTNARLLRDKIGDGCFICTRNKNTNLNQ